ncbi:TonB-linked SusC/RagA family outer membrane protein [Dyadobacter sp. BE34]|uniref:TonB-linked SusC/RagA family outer membrane protein n=1 Tax=Dyadobacter fermentans TaxID=94254 RepID=A0ABU1QUT4_9BACT|nr:MULTISPECIES: TonB-dependent receptor [Dyadobacter]MDR6804928.1 TonB-linked SusC/RagA family outer membrane protein [Dyadobacter fermentans]MDR7043313.1 TonB-linked SusC/RagA family outer membrane protein [Dyadobacter sp. BE242]MDR7197625.1 TonB-linked SusC/RagA family outer membrane protein [Dyadobacter sp. BE34]MDR7214942.1 TonB-linked SusC/RagA family outer membrane protein [Dyadobacter sp. BE31]MDR7262477.1 TonB-linked SusC/RagA family outer membrane protein [Dyadobacter sp. BE32]
MKKNRYRKNRASLCLLMRISLTQLIFSIVFSSLTYAAHTSKAQEVLERNVTLHADKVELATILDQLEQKANVKFVYSNKAIRAGRQVAIHVVNQKLAAALQTLLIPLQISYHVTPSGRILLKANKELQTKSAGHPSEQMKDMLAHVLKGKVSDENGGGLPGVSVRLKGTQLGTLTDASGNFEFEVGDQEAVLIFSFVGYKTQEVATGDRAVINISMVPDDKSLNEVVVIGYGSSRKQDVVGSVDIVASKDAGATTATNPSQLLIGKSAGVQVLQSNGTPGSDAQILIRGTGSFTGVDPLYVIDGIQGSKTMFNTLATQDIENITILKDASSTAIYGSAAANGVVIITTKRGKSGAPRINFNTQWGVAKAWKTLDLLNASQYIDLLKDFAATTNSALPAKFNTSEVTTDRTDWQKEIFRSGLVSQNDLNISGGSEKVAYNFSLGYIKQNAIVRNFSNSRLNARFALDETLGRFHLGQSLNIRYTKDDGQLASISDAVYYAPYKPIFDPTIPGGYSNTTNVDDFSNGNNPLAAINLNHPINTGFVFFPQVFAEVDIIAGLRFRTQLSAEIGGGKSRSYQYGYTGGNNLTNPQQATLGFSNYSFYTLENYFSYNKVFGKHSVSATLGNSYLDPGNSSGLNATGTKIPNDAIQNISVAQSQAVTGSNYGYARSSVISYFARLGYTFDDKYILTGSFRRDGASNFGANNRFGNFYGLGAAWRFVDEDFVKNSLNFLSDGKVRFGLGRTGNNTIPTTGVTSVLTYSGAPNGNLVYSLGTNEGFYPGTTINTLSNPNIRWESTDQTDIGLDLGFLSNRLSVTVDWYNRKSSGLLVSVPVSGSTGASASGGQPSKYANAASAQNKGVEFSVGYRDQARGGFQYNVSANLAYNKNIVNSLGSEFAAPIQAGAFSNLPTFTYTAAGSAIGSFFGYEVSHVAKDQAEIDALNAKAAEQAGDATTKYQAGLLPGDFIFKDLDGDGKVTSTDQKILGNPIPKIVYGFNAGVNYKGFDLNVVVSGVSGLKIVNAFKFVTENESTGHNASTEILKRWRKPGDVAELPRAGQSATGDGNLRPSDWWLENGSYLRLRNVTLGYTLPKGVIEGIGGGKVFKSIRVYAAAQNLLTFTKYKGYDPEVSTQNGGSFIFSRGIDDRQQLPQPRTLLCGLQLGF